MCFKSAVIQPRARIGLDAALNVWGLDGGVVWSLPLGGAARSARRFSLHFLLFLSASWPRSEVSGSPLRDLFVVFCRSPTLGSFFSRLGSDSESLADWSAPAISSLLPLDGRRWSCPSSSVRGPVLRGDCSGAASMCVRAQRGRESALTIKASNQFYVWLDACWFAA